MDDKQKVLKYQVTLIELQKKLSQLQDENIFLVARLHSLRESLRKIAGENIGEEEMRIILSALLKETELENRRPKT